MLKFFQILNILKQKQLGVCQIYKKVHGKKSRNKICVEAESTFVWEVPEEISDMGTRKK